MSSSTPRNMRRDGLRIASLFRKTLGLLDTRACDLEKVCSDFDIEVVESELEDPGYAACLQRFDGGGLIALARGQDRGRRRFSIGHELGHFHIPTHCQINGYCLERDMRARLSDAKLAEWEANDFATELLMPARLFAADSRKMDVSIATALILGDEDHYDVSVTAAAWRLVQTTREAAAVVVSAEGRVQWVYRSPAFRVPLTERGQKLQAETLAAASFGHGKSFPKPEQVDPAFWIDRACEVRGTLMESSHFIPSLRQSVSLLWHIDTEDASEEAKCIQKA